MADTRATGWRIPLLFCAGVIALTAGISALMPTTGEVVRPPFSAPLLDKAQALQIDLQKDVAGRAWQRDITAASTGFLAQAEKDANLAEVITRAVAQGRYDAACAASVLVENTPLRDTLRLDIAHHAAGECAGLAWAVMGAYGMDDPQLYAQAHSLIEARYVQCTQ